MINSIKNTFFVIGIFCNTISIAQTDNINPLKIASQLSPQAAAPILRAVEETILPHIAIDLDTPRPDSEFIQLYQQKVQPKEKALYYRTRVIPIDINYSNAQQKSKVAILIGDTVREGGIEYGEMRDGDFGMRTFVAIITAKERSNDWQVKAFRTISGTMLCVDKLFQDILAPKCRFSNSQFITADQLNIKTNTLLGVLSYADYSIYGDDFYNQIFQHHPEGEGEDEYQIIQTVSVAPLIPAQK